MSKAEYIIEGGEIYRVDSQGAQYKTNLCDLLHGIKDKTQLNAMIKVQVEEAVHDFASRLYSGYVVQRHDSEYDPDIIELSEFLIDEVVAAVLNEARPTAPKKTIDPKDVKNKEYNQALYNILRNMADVKLDSLDKDKHYLMTITYDNFSSAEYSIKNMKIVLDRFKELGLNLAFVIQVKTQGITYNITEVKE